MASRSHCWTDHKLLRDQVTWRSSVYPTIVLVLRGTTLCRTANLRTIIVIADIHRGLHNPAFHIAMKNPSWLTFRHWSGVTPYTSSYEFAGSCVFDKQLPEKLSLRPRLLAEKGQALSLTYGRFFAEFLEDILLVRLTLLELTTCVGVRYGRTKG
jgi:hypothetical protein